MHGSGQKNVEGSAFVGLGLSGDPAVMLLHHIADFRQLEPAYAGRAVVHLAWCGDLGTEWPGLKARAVGNHEPCVMPRWQAPLQLFCCWVQHNVVEQDVLQLHNDLGGSAAHRLPGHQADTEQGFFKLLSMSPHTQLIVDKVQHQLHFWRQQRTKPCQCSHQNGLQRSVDNFQVVKLVRDHVQPLKFATRSRQAIRIGRFARRVTSTGSAGLTSQG